MTQKPLSITKIPSQNPNLYFSHAQRKLGELITPCEHAKHREERRVQLANQHGPVDGNRDALPIAGLTALCQVL